jgi:hypothetical protein
MRSRRLLRTGFVGGLLVAMPSPALANVGIPMLAYAWPVAWLLLIPVILLEALVARRILRAGWSSALKITGLSNFVSTLIGIPLAWAAVLLIGTVVHGVVPRPLDRWAITPFYAAWLPPLSERHPWLFPASGALLCIPFLFASVWIERIVAQRFAGFQPTDIRCWAWRANLLSYSLIAAGLIIAAALMR